MRDNNSITDIPGLKVGHAQDEEALTGCTVVLCETGAVAGVDQRGGAPGTRETDSLRPMHLVQQVHAVLLSGGSAFGLDAAGGVMRFLEERGIGFDAGVARVPIVPAAILFDLSVGRADIRPDAAMGYAACQAASNGPVSEGNVGAGCGATAGKVLGMRAAMKTGIGSASAHLGGGLVVGALAAVNAYGDVIDPNTGRILAGARHLAAEIQVNSANTRTGPFADTLTVMKDQAQPGEVAGLKPSEVAGLKPSEVAVQKPTEGPFTLHEDLGGNTIIGVVATNARLNKDGANKVAQMAQDGLARAVRPAHTMYDGDTIFALATGEYPADISLVGAFAAEVFAQAIVRAVVSAAPAAGLPSASSLSRI